jgi:starch phosphorylase
MSLTQKMVQGADVWINTPRPPWEASGTSGMKVLVNGGLNLSVLDGWWSEAYKPEFGWAVRSVNESDRDARDAAQIYSLLEDEIKPLFYDRDASGTPVAWIAKVRASMVHLTPRFSARRAVMGYLEHYYQPAAEAFVRRSENGARLAKEIVVWKAKITQSWNDVRVVSRETQLPDDAEPRYLITANVRLGRLSPEDVTVEAYAENNGAGAVRISLTLQSPAPDDASIFVYAGEVPCDRPETHYTVRVLPRHPEVQIPLELNEIAWER